MCCKENHTQRSAVWTIVNKQQCKTQQLCSVALAVYSSPVIKFHLWRAQKHWDRFPLLVRTVFVLGKFVGGWQYILLFEMQHWHKSQRLVLLCVHNNTKKNLQQFHWQDYACFVDGSKCIKITYWAFLFIVAMMLNGWTRVFGFFLEEMLTGHNDLFSYVTSNYFLLVAMFYLFRFEICLTSYINPSVFIFQSAAMEETVIWEQHTVTLHRVCNLSSFTCPLQLSLLKPKFNPKNCPAIFVSLPLSLHLFFLHWITSCSWLSTQRLKEKTKQSFSYNSSPSLTLEPKSSAHWNVFIVRNYYIWLLYFYTLM